MSVYRGWRLTQSMAGHGYFDFVARRRHTAGSQADVKCRIWDVTGGLAISPNRVFNNRVLLINRDKSGVSTPPI
jgi:hypothetical protein